MGSPSGRTLQQWQWHEQVFFGSAGRSGGIGAVTAVSTNESRVPDAAAVVSGGRPSGVDMRSDVSWLRTAAGGSDNGGTPGIWTRPHLGLRNVNVAAVYLFLVC